MNKPNTVMLNGVSVHESWPPIFKASQKVKKLKMTDGKMHVRIKYGHEGWDSGQPCHDCAAKEGQYHALGCDVEKCPKCRGQLISCGCWEDDDPSVGQP